LLLVLMAAALAAAGDWLRLRRVAPAARALATAAALATIAAVSIAGFRNYGVFRRDDRLLAALDLARRNDVAAVLDLATPWYLSGGFYYLHHDVPYYFKPQFDALGGIEARQLASHVLVDASAPDLPGFRQLSAHGGVRILEQVSPPAAYLAPGKDGREPLQDGVDDRFTPAPRSAF
jgi:hypothetical protein